MTTGKELCSMELGRRVYCLAALPDLSVLRLGQRRCISSRNRRTTLGAIFCNWPTSPVMHEVGSISRASALASLKARWGGSTAGPIHYQSSSQANSHVRCEMDTRHAQGGVLRLPIVHAFWQRY